MDSHPLIELVRLQKKGVPAGIYSVCSANELVIEAVMDRAKAGGGPVLIEATANQVNQYGGYTGMKPADFRDFVFSIAEKRGFPRNRIILGGDHLGPLTWKDLPSEKAMEESKELIRQFVQAGFTKIHLDTSMYLADDDKGKKLDTGVIAKRGAELCETAEKAFTILQSAEPMALHPVYVVGSEVPIPGGSQEEEEGLQVTRASAFEETVSVFKKAFHDLGLHDAWEQVMAIVVQPGVEFGDESIHAYNREAAGELTEALKKYPNLVFEGHSTDYQTPVALKQMVEDGIAILKVGPALTFALREALFALCMIEKELSGDSRDVEPSGFIDVLEAEMLRHPENWKKHYHGDEGKLRLARKYSLSDRCRYYLPVNEVNLSINRLMDNLSRTPIPLTLLSQYMPVQYAKVRSGTLANDPLSLAKDRVINCIDEYLYATKP